MKNELICFLVAMLFICMLAMMCYFKNDATFWRDAYLELSRARATETAKAIGAPIYAIEDIVTTNVPPGTFDVAWTNATPISR